MQSATPKTTSVPATPARTDPPVDPGAVQLVRGIIGLIDEMVQVMESEIDLVEKRRTKEHAELLKRKQRLAVDYRASLRQIALQPDYLKKVPTDLREAARAAGQKLNTASERNARALRAAIGAVERLTKTIISLVKKEVMPTSSYANVQAGGGKLGYSPMCKPVTGSRTA